MFNVYVLYRFCVIGLIYNCRSSGPTLVVRVSAHLGRVQVRLRKNDCDNVQEVRVSKVLHDVFDVKNHVNASAINKSKVILYYHN